MLNYLIKNWPYMGLLAAIYLTILLLSSWQSLSLYIFLIWLQLPIYMLHQFEEHAWPGHFKEYFNKHVFHITDKDVPLNDTNIFWINILAIWVLFPIAAVLAQTVNPQWGILLPVFGIFNATTHIIMSIRSREYNPGLAVSVFLNYPLGIYALYVANAEHVLNSWNVALAVIVTLFVHMLIARYMAYRYNR